MTNRARMLLLLATMTLVAGLFGQHEGVALAGLTVLLWIGLEGLTFFWKVRLAGSSLLRASRTIDGSDRGQLVVTVDSASTVALAAAPAAALAGLRLWVEDVTPLGATLLDGASKCVADLVEGEPLRWQYTLRVETLGKQRLPGLQTLLSDPHGLFQHRQFIPLLQELTVLPFLIRPRSTVSVLKQRNHQVLSGQHRHPRSGLGGELLSIREYRSGDPPRTIAWKASARTGRLMTCEFESEVPIRATIIADLSPHQYAGRPGPAVADQILSVTASIARLLLTDRDPVAAVIVRDAEYIRVSHGHGERQLTRLLHRLLADQQAESIPHDIPMWDLLAMTWVACSQRFPELFDVRVNPQVGLFRWSARSRQRVRREQLAQALAQLYRRPLGHAQALLVDEPRLASACRQYLVDYPAGPVQGVGVAPFQRAAQSCSMEAMCRGLLEGVARARDNELFVLVGGWPGAWPQLSTLERALRTARAALHRVMFLTVSREEPLAHLEDATARGILERCAERDESSIQAGLEMCLRPLGVPLARLTSPELTEQIAAEIELLRFGRARSRSHSRGVPG